MDTPTRTSAFRVLAEALPAMISAVVGQHPTNSRPLGGITKKVAEHLNAEICSIWLFEKGGKDLVAREAHGYATIVEGKTHRLDQGLTPRIVLERMEFVLNWTVQDRELGWVGDYDKELRSHCWSLLGVPIISSKSGKPIGALKLENKQKKWGSQDIGKYLLSVSDQEGTPAIILEILEKKLLPQISLLTTGPHGEVFKKHLNSLLSLVHGLGQSASQMRFITKAGIPQITDPTASAEGMEERVIGQDHLKHVLDSMLWHLDAIHGELERMVQILPSDELLSAISRRIQALRLSLGTYDPFTAEDLLLARAVAAMIAAALDILDIDRTAYLQYWERLTHSLNHVTRDFLAHLDFVAREYLSGRDFSEDEELRSRLAVAYRSGIVIDGTRELFEKKDAGEDEQIARTWQAGAIERQVKTRVRFYQRLGALLRCQVNYQCQLDNFDSEYTCILGRLLGALDVLIDNAFLYGRSNVDLRSFQRQGELVVEVRDHGDGLPTGFRISRHTERHFKFVSGAGKGLYNAQEALADFDGSLKYSNAEDSSGAVFQIVLQHTQVKS